MTNKGLVNRELSGRLFVALLVMVIGQEAVAQTSLGVKGGLNLSDVVINNIIDPDAESDYHLKPGVHAGLYLNADFDERTGLGIELLYSDKGVNPITNIHLHYIAVPFLARYRLRDNWVVEAGPELAYLFSAQSKYGNVNHIWDNKIDLGLDIGLQYSLSRLMMGLRLNAGVSSVIRNAMDSGGNRIKYQNRTLQLSMGYRLRQFD